MQDPSPHPKPGLNGVPPSADRAEGAGASDVPAQRLPPPMFPPGSRRSPTRGGAPPAQPREDDEYDVPEDAFIMPDEPFRRSPSRTDPGGASGAGAPPRDRRMTDPAQVRTGVATGLGEPSPHPDEELQISAASAGDPHVAELIRLVRRLSDSLLRKGEAGLRASPDMTRFEATLRAYCVGFLAATRAVDRSRPQA